MSIFLSIKNMIGICNICLKTSSIISCNFCKINACSVCVIDFTREKKFMNRNCICGNGFTIDNLYTSFGKEFMRNEYIDTIVQNKFIHFSESSTILETFQKTDQKYEEICKTPDLYKFDDVEKYKQQMKELYQKFYNLDEMTSFYDIHSNLNDKHALMQNKIDIYLNNLDGSQCHEIPRGIKKIIKNNLNRISKSFQKIYLMQKNCGTFRLNKEQNMYKFKTNMIGFAIMYVIEKKLSQDKFIKLLKNNEVISEKIDTVLEYVRQSWKDINYIRIKADHILNTSNSIDFLEDRIQIAHTYNQMKHLGNGSDVKATMKARFNMTDEELIEYWTIPLA
jgi:hypothetical protein